MRILKETVNRHAFDKWIEVKGLGIVHADATREGQPYFWYEFNEQEPEETFRYRVVGTGWEFPENAYHVKTYFEGPFVWHLIQEFGELEIPE